MDELDLVGLRLLSGSTAPLKEGIAAGEPTGPPSDTVDADQIESSGCEGEDKKGGSEGDSSTSSSSSSSSDDDDEDDDESSDDRSDESGRDEDDGDGGDCGSKRVERGIKASELEDGEIGGLEEPMVDFGSDDDDDEEGVAKAPIRSKHEIEFLPPVPSVNATLEQHHQITPVGTILSVVGTKVIVQGKEQHNPLSEGSILWISKSKQPLGFVDEIFGPVKTPFYVVRYNSEVEVPSGIHEGTLVSYVAEFADHVLNNKDLYKKGYDASGENDEEIADEFEFSDDETEAEFKRLQRTTKRVNANSNHNAGDFRTNKMVNEKGRSRNRSSWFSQGVNANAMQQELPTSTLAGVSCQPQFPHTGTAAVFSGGWTSMQTTQPIGVWPNTMFLRNSNSVPVGSMNNMLQNINQFQPYIQNNYQYPNVASLPTQFAFQQIPPSLNAMQFPSNLIDKQPPVALNFPLAPMAAPHVWPATHVQPINNEALAAASLPTGGQPPSYGGNVMHATKFNPGTGSVGGRGKPSRQHRGNHFSGRRGRQ